MYFLILFDKTKENEKWDSSLKKLMNYSNNPNIIYPEWIKVETLLKKNEIILIRYVAVWNRKSYFPMNRF